MWRLKLSISAGSESVFGKVAQCGNSSAIIGHEFAEKTGNQLLSAVIYSMRQAWSIFGSYMILPKSPQISRLLPVDHFPVLTLCQ